MFRLAAILLLLPALASADPGPATRWLMNEPASLLDVGFIKLNDRLDDYTDSVETSFRKDLGDANFMNDLFDAENTALFFIGAMYNFEDDKIVIEFGAVGYIGPIPKSGCRNSIKLLRTVMPRVIEQSFTHQGYQNAGEPDDLADSLQERTVLSCKVSKDFSDEMVLLVEGDLLGEGYAVTEYPDE